eukprot:CAMPEP_0196759524 /NCGR_PEP_ID=MMETSP1091-20130531/104744_1 /TAXON_ID=302021 /ORGANISM="Rhodomonas sp., Strain CCMP768" /LENGTH=479 /DNA_ID=CAMNT_0042108375 /DNA_START=95 /DNA_END=1534 /DNA_ORIENTATION=-
MGNCCFKGKPPPEPLASAHSLVPRPSTESNLSAPVDPKNVQFTVGASAHKRKEGAAASKGNLFGMERYQVRTDLREMLEKKEVVLIKASWLSKQGFKKRSSLPSRSTLEDGETDALADVALVERCFKEVVRAATELVGDELCHYPGVVVVSYRWLTAAHPDPKGKLLQMLAPMLEWYGAQRAVLGLDPEFCVFIDFCSLHIPPHADVDQTTAFEKVKKSMDIWYGHMGTMTWILSAPPKDSDPPRKYSEGAWPTFERAACVGKLPVYCLDMGRFEGWENRKFEKEWRNKYREQFAKHGKRHQAPTDASLRPLVEGSAAVPLMAEAFNAALQPKECATADDRMVICDLYNQVSRARLGSSQKLSFALLRWTPAEFATFAGTMAALCQNLETLHVTDAAMSDADIEEWCRALLAGALPKLATLRLDNNDFSDKGCTALQEALSRGAMPVLADLQMRGTSVTGAGADAVRGAAGSRELQVSI